MTILIVDDEVDIRQLLSTFLTHKGYRAISVANGEAALNYLRQHQPLPQLILLDLMMPVMNGMDFRRAQQRDPQLAAIPVVVMSAAGEMQASALPGDIYLPKPIDFAALLTLVEQYCSQSRQHGG
jgi:CheY-like chemotaxis protein